MRSQTNTPPAQTNHKRSPPVVLGVCAMDVKARSKAMREILTRLNQIQNGGVEVKIFGDVVILDEGSSELMHVRSDGNCSDADPATVLNPHHTRPHAPATLSD